MFDDASDRNTVVEETASVDKGIVAVGNVFRVSPL